MADGDETPKSFPKLDNNTQKDDPMPQWQIYLSYRLRLLVAINVLYLNTSKCLRDQTSILLQLELYEKNLVTITEVFIGV